MNKKLLISIFWSILLLWTSFWYFENKYYCKIWDNKITVTIKKENNTKCIKYIEDINKKLIKYEENIKNANEYISQNEDIKYWINIRDKLESDKKNVQIIKENIIQYMDNFEKEFFVKIKKMLSFHLIKDEQKLSKTLKFKKETYKNGILNWDVITMKESIEKIDETNIKISLIEKMLSSENFESLIPYLRYYLEIIK